MKASLFFSALWLAVASFFSPPEKAILTGTVTDGKEPLIGASIKVMKDNVFIAGSITDLNGLYRLELDPGKYQLEVAYTGFETFRFIDVTLTPGKTHIMDATMSSTVLTEVVITAYKVPLIQQDNTSGGQTLTSDQIKNLPTRSVNAIIATEPGKTSIDGGDVTILGSREDKTGHELDDVAVLGTTTPAKSDERRELKSSAPLKKAPAPKGEAPMGAAPTKPVTYTGETKPVPPPPSSESTDIIVGADGRKKRVVVAFAPETYEEKIVLIDVEDGKLYEGDVAEMADEAITSGTISQPKPRAGLLTAGEWNDLHNWNRHWTDLQADGEIASYENMYGFFARQRYTVMLSNNDDIPLADMVVQLKNAGDMIWEARTDNTGKAELWAGLYDKKTYSDLGIEVWVNGKKQAFKNPKTAKNGFNFIKVDAPCAAPTNVDIVWAVDATGSMGDEIEYLKTEVLDVIGRAKNNNPALSFRMGTAFYRDKGDAYIVKSSGLSTDIERTVEFIQKQSAGGGGDYPEAVHSALEEVVYGQKWSENAIARICFLVLDASPHQDPAVIESIQKSIREAAKLGIRIVPLAASGIQKDTEFLMKFFGLATNGTYLFLTDHSGIGGKHLEPTSDEYKVEPLNDLFVRIITEYTSLKTCEGKSNIRFEDDPQQQPGATIQASYFPNPAVDQFTLELPYEVQSVTLYDSEGKGVRKIEKPQAGANIIRVNDLTAGFYTIRIMNNGRMQSGKLLVVRS